VNGKGIQEIVVGCGHHGRTDGIFQGIVQGAAQLGTPASPSVG